MTLYVCDGCGKQQEADHLPHGDFKPSDWFSRHSDELKRDMHACSRDCIERAKEEHGGHDVVSPI